ncbi:MAG: ATP-binding protein [Holophaga sp.]|nr:ATP-binding protein [Holophaga sp.]
MRLRRSLEACARLVQAVLALGLSLALAAGVGDKRVLILTSYGAGRPGVEALLGGFRTTLGQAGMSVEQVFTENLDLERSRDEGFRRSLAQTLRLKYGRRPVDLVYVVEQPALDFTLQHLPDVVRGAPILAVRAVLPGSARGPGPFVRQLITYDLDGTLRLAMNLFPRTRRVLFVAGSAPSDRELLAGAARAMAPWPGVAREDTTGLTVDQVEAWIRNPGPGTVIMVLPFNRDSAGRSVVQMEMAFLVAARAGAPVFTLWDNVIGQGAVGGSVTNFEDVGRQAAEFSLGLLDGRTVLAGPVTDLPARSFIRFDWRQLQRWHGDPAGLPAASRFVNRPATLWQQYRRTVIVTGVFLLGQSLLIALLLVQRRLRALAQQRLRQSDEALRRSRFMLMRTEALSHIGGWQWEAATDTVVWSDEMYRIVQRDPAQGVPAIAEQRAIYHPDDMARLAPLIDQAMAHGVPYEIELRALRPGGEVRICLARGYPELGPGGQVTGLFGSLQDITEPKQTGEHERNLEAQLQQAQKMESLGLLVAGVAHNLNNVLAIVMGTASLREQVATDPQDRESYRNIGQVCLRGRDVVKSLIHFAEPTLAVQAPFELHGLIQEVCSLLDSTTRNSIHIVTRFAEGPLWLQGDAGSINHALVNLCVNSLDAMPGGGTLTLSTAVLGEGQVEVSVQDDGAGIPPEVLDHVMEPFFTTKPVGKGTGLGLSMTYGVVKAHGGTIRIGSEPGRGTTVTLRFPRIPAPAPSADVPAAAPSLKALTVILVDDDEDVRFLMTRMLKRAGVRQVKTFAAGDAALDYLRTGELPDLVILDQNMPGLNGSQTLERIRARFPHLPVLISSGQPDIEAWPCFRLPGVGVISKPFTLEEIQAKLGQFG